MRKYKINKSEAKDAIKRYRHERKRCTSHPWDGRYQIRAIESAGKGKTLMAVITVGKSDFYDPMEALRRQILADAKDQPGPVRHLDPSEVSPASLRSDKPRAYERMPMKHFLKRIRQMDSSFLRMWGTHSPLPRGYFFLYRDRVLLQTWTAEEGFKLLRVPEEGIDRTPSPVSGPPMRLTKTTAPVS